MRYGATRYGKEKAPGHSRQKKSIVLRAAFSRRPLERWKKQRMVCGKMQTPHAPLKDGLLIREHVASRPHARW